MRCLVDKEVDYDMEPRAGHEEEPNTAGISSPAGLTAWPSTPC